MDWIFLAILAPFLWSVSNLIDKFLLTHKLKNPLSSMTLFAAVCFLSLIPTYLIHPPSSISTLNLTLTLFVGILNTLVSYFYFRALYLEEVSRIIPWFYISPIFIMIFAAIFLGESLSPWNYLGTILLVAGAFLITFKKNLSLGKAFWLMMACMLVSAIGSVITKQLLNIADYWTVFFYNRLGTLILAIPLAIGSFKDFRNAVKKNGNSIITFIAISEALAVFGLFIFNIATQQASVTVVNAISSIQPLFMLVLAVIISRFFSHIIKEDISRKTLFLKFIAVALIILGAFLVT